MSLILSIDDLRKLAQKRIPRAIFDYAAGGAYEERTLLRNTADLDALTFRQRVMVDVSKVSLATTLVGTPVSMPLAIGPTGLAGLFHADGEILAARAGGGVCGGVRHSLLHEHHVDLFDRGCASGDPAAVLVPAIPHEGSRLQSR